MFPRSHTHMHSHTQTFKQVIKEFSRVHGGLVCFGWFSPVPPQPIPGLDCNLNARLHGPIATQHGPSAALLWFHGRNVCSVLNGQHEQIPSPTTLSACMHYLLLVGVERRDSDVLLIFNVSKPSLKKHSREPDFTCFSPLLPQSSRFPGLL